MPTTIVANHMKVVVWREKAGRSGWSAFQQAFQSDR
jgi:hypothetical protein